MKLLPDHEFNSILARILVYPNDPELKVEADELLSKICEYTNYEHLGKCLEDKWVDKIKRTKITGQNWNEVLPFKDNINVEPFRLEAYKITL